MDKYHKRRNYDIMRARLFLFNDEKRVRCPVTSDQCGETSFHIARRSVEAKAKGTKAEATSVRGLHFADGKMSFVQNYSFQRSLPNSHMRGRLLLLKNW